ncbi:MAG: histone deacetylase [bacterium]
MAQTGFVFHEDYLKHDTGMGHPERPERLQALIESLRHDDYLTEFAAIRATAAEVQWIEQVHSLSYIKQIEKACTEGQVHLDADTVVCGDSFRAALLAVGGAVNACEAVMAGQIENAFCAVRPPGHHAEPARAMGFCLFNNIAVAARYLQDHLGVGKVAIIDWDVHHGNGTQHAFYDDPTVFYCSLHQHPLFPGTGRSDETGSGPAAGTTLNFPLPPGCGDREYVKIFEKDLLPAVRNFGPDFILISAGFDAHRDDPLANMEVTEDGFRQMTAVVRALAQECCSGRVISLLEGGYHLSALAKSVRVHLNGLQL